MATGVSSSDFNVFMFCSFMFYYVYLKKYYTDRVRITINACPSVHLFQLIMMQIGTEIKTVSMTNSIEHSESLVICGKIVNTMHFHPIITKLGVKSFFIPDVDIVPILIKLSDLSGT